MYFDIDYDEEKNELLKKLRRIGFADVLNAIIEGGYVDVLEHPNKKKFAHQQILIVRIGSYIYKVPFVKDNKKRMIFLKTLYPDRKLTKIYIK